MQHLGGAFFHCDPPCLCRSNSQRMGQQVMLRIVRRKHLAVDRRMAGNWASWMSLQNWQCRLRLYIIRGGLKRSSANVWLKTMLLVDLPKATGQRMTMSGMAQPTQLATSKNNLYY